MPQRFASTISRGYGQIRLHLKYMLPMGYVHISSTDTAWIIQYVPSTGKSQVTLYSLSADLVLLSSSPTNPGGVEILFDEPQKSIALGQVATLWNMGGEWCLGCGEITNTSPLASEA